MNSIFNFIKNTNYYYLIIIIFGIFYGGIVYQFPQESVTFAKTFLGHYNYNKSNLWYLGVLQSPPTLQIYFPYLLLKFGFNDAILNFVLGSTTCTISFLAIFLLAKLVTKNNLISLIVPTFFIFHRFIDTHWYGIYFPVNYFYFGQMGMYLTLCSLSLYCLQNKKTSLIFFVFNFFCHSSWGSFNLFCLVLLSLKEKKIPPIKIFHLILFCSLFLTMIYTYNDFNKINDYDNFYYKNLNNAEIKNFFEDTNTEKISYKKSHSPRFDISKDLVKNSFEIFRFFFYEILLIVIFLVYRKNLSKQLLYFFHMLLIASTIVCFTYFLKQYTNLFDTFSFLHPKIPFLIDRMLISRFLNINNVFVLVFSFAFLLSKIENKELIFPKLYFFVFLISYFALFIFKGQIVVEHIPVIKTEKIIMNSFIWINYPIAIIYFLFSEKIEIFLSLFSKLFNFKKIIFFQFTLFLSLFIFYIMPIKYNSFKSFTDSNNQIFDKIDNQDYKEIIVGPLIYGYIDPSYLSESPVLLAMHTIRSEKNYKMLDVWCDNQFDIFDSTTDYYNFIYNECFAKRKKNEWINIGKELNINFVITREYVNLDLTLVESNDFIKLYKIF